MHVNLSGAFDIRKALEAQIAVIVINVNEMPKTENELLVPSPSLPDFIALAAASSCHRLK